MRGREVVGETDETMRAFVAGWFAHARNPEDAPLVVEDAWHAYRLTESADAPVERVLHPSHRWGQRPVFERDEPGGNRYRERKLPCCLNCLVDGYEDEPAAFQPCRRITSPSGATAPDQSGEGVAEGVDRG